MLIPAPNGINVALFDMNRINEYREEIGELLDQIPVMSENIGVSFDFFKFRTDGVQWTDDPYVMQMLYLLGVVSDQCMSIEVNGNPSIGRINKTKAIVTTIEEDKDGKKRVLEVKVGEQKYHPKENN